MTVKSIKAKGKRIKNYKGDIIKFISKKIRDLKNLEKFIFLK